MPDPTTAILDSFTRANVSPLNGNWSPNVIWSGTANGRVVSNQMRVTAGGTDAHPFWGQVFPQNQEVYATVVNVAGMNGFYLAARGQNFNSGSPQYYALECKADGTFQIIDHNDNVIGTPTTQALANGDSVWLRCYGDTISGYYKAAASGTFTQLVTGTDTVHRHGGQIGMMMGVSNEATAIVDNFGGGAIMETAGSSDITGKGKAPFRSAWAMLQDGGGYKPGGAFLSKGVFWADNDTADKDMLTDYFFDAASAPISSTKFFSMF